MDGDDEEWPTDRSSEDEEGSSSSRSYDSSDDDDRSSSSDSSSRGSYSSDGSSSSSDGADDDDNGSSSSSSYDDDDGYPRRADGVHHGGGAAGPIDELWHATFSNVVRNRRGRSRSRHDDGVGMGGSNHANDVRVGVYDEDEHCDHDDDDDDDAYAYGGHSDDDCDYGGDAHAYDDRRRRRRSYYRPSRGGGTIRRLYRRMYVQCRDTIDHQCPNACSRRSTAVLVFAVLLWLVVHVNYASPGGRGHGRKHDRLYTDDGGGIMSRSFLEGLRTDRRTEAEAALGSAAGNDYKRKDRRKEVNRKKKSGKGNPDKLPAGCSYPQGGWHGLSYPTCNDLHEVDLRQGFHPRRKAAFIEASDAAAMDGGGRAVGYVGSGLWRDVWKVDPRGEAGRRSAYRGDDDGDGDYDDDDDDDDDDRVPPAVLKVMKSEHPYDVRNHDRHRRDALVMERLTSSRHVVDVYGYCGNSVLTEYVGRTLDELIYEEEKKKGGGSREVHHDEEEDDKEEEWVHDAARSVPTRETPAGRIRLALDVFRGIAAVHELEGGPIVHADLQAKQFLVDRRTGTVKLNDYNRCRFLPRKDGQETADTCPLKIPQAPGVNRSPEEYNQLRVNEKIDVFSGAHVLYGILTGRRFWDSSSRKTIKSAIMAGQKPVIPEEYRRDPIDGALADLIYRAYEFDAGKRISASEMVRELEQLLAAARGEDHDPSFRKV